ncbi:DUF2024 family protein [Motilimonas pumila]|uniref:DUF2024 family protein n=2 Tax=Motilimonas pumila TaxID=2303987 RepID=A0A418YDG8_9GAMM|nr:DUF2024 family protein [Motilimonas pumila]
MTDKDSVMTLHVFDTFSYSGSGRILHFDVLLPEKDEQRAIACARQWLTSIGDDYIRCSS